MKNKEFILCAAILYNNGAKPNVTNIESGIVICGRRHSDCYKALEGMIGKVDDAQLPQRDAQGFLTSTNRYVGRSEAWKIAEANNQIAFGKEASENGSDSILISENLY